MSGRTERSGGPAAAAAVAQEVEGQAGPAPCLNCGAPLAGAYCHACGQRAHLHRSLWHVGEEVLHGVLHFDAKLWRTLPLLVARPGVLTRRYINGQRASYVSPMGLFLFSIFLMYLAFSLFGVVNIGLPAAGSPELREARLELQEALREAEHDLAARERDLAEARKASAGVDAATQEVAAARQEVAAARAALAVVEAPASRPLSVGEVAARAASAAATSSAGAGSAAAPSAGLRLGGLTERLKANPELLVYKLKNTAYKFAFMLVPISLPFLWLLFIGRAGVAAYDHAVFALYSLSFMSLFAVLLLLLNKTFLEPWVLPMLAAAPVHMILQMRDTYGIRSGWALLAYAIGLLVVVSLALGLFVMFVLWAGV